MSTLPPLDQVLSSSADRDGPLAKALATLFESSPILFSALVPGLATHLSSESSTSPTSYAALIDAALAVISTWSDTLRAQFIAGHPRIGEVNGLSHLSAKEQLAAATPPEVLARLVHLNALYEHRYPGLRYITFVNGRARAVIKDEMEDVLQLERSLSPGQPPVESVGSVEIGGEEWRGELDRAVVDVGRIAKGRLRALGIE
ncbi:Oxo-4-hydroxy-4-carboxy-5-ureidoimidazoline decarboxylase [Amylocystis lapponica]|nr:Oxo-4-hydroxy-4-carboxy-5-ureidoimidazoline decarboxylase [Amylocystis lapponica]